MTDRVPASILVGDLFLPSGGCGGPEVTWTPPDNLGIHVHCDPDCDPDGSDGGLVWLQLGTPHMDMFSIFFDREPLRRLVAQLTAALAECDAKSPEAQ